MRKKQETKEAEVCATAVMELGLEWCERHLYDAMCGLQAFLLMRRRQAEEGNINYSQYELSRHIAAVKVALRAIEDPRADGWLFSDELRAGVAANLERFLEDRRAAREKNFARTLSLEGKKAIVDYAKKTAEAAN